jgi:signal transduction histidine kinase/CHASE3 domain sensor protein/ActR/RegA family two-component response regulator
MSINSKSDRRFAYGFVVAIAGLIVLGFFLQKSIQDVEATATLRARARIAAFQVKALSSLLVDAETGQRGYLLVGDKKYLAPYDTALREIPSALHDLKQSLGSQPEQLARLDRAEALINQKLNELARTIELKNGGREREALSLVKQGHGQSYMDELRQLFLSMDEGQRQLITLRHQHMDDVVAKSATAVLAGSLLAILVVTSLLILLDRNQKRRAEVERSLRESNAFLEKQKAVASKVIAIQNRIATAPNESRDIMELVVSLSMELTEADGSIIEIIEGDEMVYHYVHGKAVPFLGLRLPKTGSFSGLCIEQGQAIVCHDSETDPRVNREACRKVGLRSMAVVPLHYGGRPIGVLKNYSATPNHFEELTFGALNLLMGLASAALGQAREFEEKSAAIGALEKAKAELTVSRDQAQQATEAKSRFLANMSHEVRTPLNGILGMTSLLLDRPLEAEAREYASSIKMSGEALLALVNDILDFSKIEAGRLELEHVDFDLFSTLQDIAKTFTHVARQKNLSLTLETDPKLPHLVNGDPGRIRQILLNLIGNAIKFTPKGSIHIKLTCLNPEDVRLRFDVRDTGIGIDAATIKTLFREFSQADVSTTRRYGGTGLGLSICKKLVELMGGEVGVESEVGQGSNFWFTLQLALARAQKLKSESEAIIELATDGRPWRVLVGEDNQVNQIIIAKMLERLGVRCDVAGNGKEVIEAVQMRPYDLILMDCHMPEMDGYEATSFIRESKSIANNRIPIIAMTANALKGDREKTLAAGMDDYLSKPLDIKKVRSVLAKWLTTGLKSVS